MKILTDGGKKSHIHTQKAHIEGNVSAHAAQAHLDRAGVGICLHQTGKGAAAYIHIHTTDYHRISLLPQDIAFSGNVTLLLQVRDVDGHGSTGNAQFFRQLLLRDHRIFFQKSQYLLFSLGHSLTFRKLLFIFKHIFIV